MTLVYKSYPLHERVEFQEQCADILNAEWPRSKAARLHVLRKSQDTLPFNIVFVSVDEHNEETAIGHSRLSAVHGDEAACFVESVIINKQLRGKGLGRVLMTETEDHARKLGFSAVYLTTHDQQKFYERVGYDYCEPIVHIGAAGAIVKPDFLKKLFGDIASKPDLQTSMSNLAITKTTNKDDVAAGNLQRKNVEMNNSVLPVPPPPPPPPPSKSDDINADESIHTAAKPAPPPPPPVRSKKGQQPNAITRIPRSAMSWMKKSLQ